MGKAKYLTCMGGFGLCLTLQSLSLLAQQGIGPGATPAVENGTKEEKSLLPEAARAAPPAGKKQSDICQCLAESDSASVERIERVLRGPLHSNGFDYVDTPLKDVVQGTADDYDIPIQLDQPALDEAGINADQPVTVTVRNISVQSGLKIMLKKLNLTYVIRDEVLVITTTAAAERDLKVCAYNVSGMLGDRGSDLESVADMIRSCIASDTWAKNGGGQSEIRAIKPDLLVISQTPAVQEQIRDLLSAIRKIHEQGGERSGATTKSAEAKHDEVVTRSYVLQMNPTNDTNALRSQLRELIVNALPDEAWAGRLGDGQPVSLAVFHDRIVVRQTPAVQEKVEKVLVDSGIATPAPVPNAPGAPGMMGAPGAGLFGVGEGMAPGGAEAPASGSPFGGAAGFGPGFGGGGLAPGGAAGFAPSPAPSAGE